MRAEEDWTAALLIHPNGDFDGVVCMPTSRLYRVDEGGRYGEKMRRLLKFDPTRFSVKLEGGNLAAATLELARDTGKIVSLELEESGLDDVTGFVESVDGNACAIRRVDEHGFPDGTSTVALDSVTRISCDTDEEQRILRLYEAVRSE